MTRDDRAILRKLFGTLWTSVRPSMVRMPTIFYRTGSHNALKSVASKIFASSRAALSLVLRVGLGISLVGPLPVVERICAYMHTLGLVLFSLVFLSLDRNL